MSPWRFCAKCVTQGGQPAVVADYDTGLCEFHAQPGNIDKPSPRAKSIQVSLPRLSGPVTTGVLIAAGVREAPVAFDPSRSNLRQRRPSYSPEQKDGLIEAAREQIKRPTVTMRQLAIKAESLAKEKAMDITENVLYQHIQAYNKARKDELTIVLQKKGF